MNNYDPPRLALRFFRWFCQPDIMEDIEGDLHERFNAQIEEHGIVKSKRKFHWQVLFLLRPGIVRSSIFKPTLSPMFRQNLKISARSLRKNKSHAWINVGGLALGLMAFMLIAFWVCDELTFDRQFENSDKIARVMQNQSFGNEIRTWGSQAMQLAPVLRDEYGHLFKEVVLSSNGGNNQVTYEDKKLMINGRFMEPAIVDVLSLTATEGALAAIQDPSQVLLSVSAAKRIFDDDEAIGQTLQIGNNMLAQVGGIYADLPRNSSFSNLDFIAPWQLLETARNYSEKLGWGNSWFNVFAQVHEEVDFAAASAAIASAKRDHIEQEYADRTQPELFLHPLEKWRLYERFENGVNAGGRIEYIWIFAIVGIFILSLACINFMNLSTAKSEQRAKEVGIRKTIGSTRNQLIHQFLSETFLVVVFAFLASLVMVRIALPYFNIVTEKELAMPWLNPTFWIVAIPFLLLLTIVAGGYPSFYLSSFRPIKILSGIQPGSNRTVSLRRVLVTVQFVVSVVLIIGTMIIVQQMQFAKDRPIGYNQDNIINIPIRSGEVMKHFDALHHELLATGHVERVAASDVKITSTYTTNSGFYWEGKDPHFSDEFKTLRATHGYGDLIEWEVVEGRDFSADHPSDTLAFLLNETAVGYMDLDKPIGRQIRWGDEGVNGNGTFQVIGIVKDMITTSPYQEVPPMIYVLHYGRFISGLNLKLRGSSSPSDALAAIEQVYTRYDSENIFTYEFADEAYANKFGNEERLVKIASFFALVAIFISCIGLLGISALSAERRRKEMGVRKVLGASVEKLWLLLSKEFIVIVLLAVFIAIPIAYYYMDQWVSNFSYHIDLQWWVFVAGGLSALIIALATVSYHAARAAISNPVEALRSE